MASLMLGTRIYDIRGLAKQILGKRFRNVENIAEKIRERYYARRAAENSVNKNDTTSDEEEKDTTVIYDGRRTIVAVKEISTDDCEECINDYLNDNDSDFLIKSTWANDRLYYYLSYRYMGHVCTNYIELISEYKRTCKLLGLDDDLMLIAALGI